MRRAAIIAILFSLAAGVACAQQVVYVVPATVQAPVIQTQAPVVQTQAHGVCPKCGKCHACQAAGRGAASQATASTTGRPAGITYEYGRGYELQVARAEALECAKRDRRMRNNHTSISLRSGRSNGVGYSSNDPTPRTCFWSQRRRGAYAVARGRSGGYYACLVLY